MKVRRVRRRIAAAPIAVVAIVAGGRLMVVITHNTGIADTWEREGEDQEYFRMFCPAGYAIGVTVVLYAMTH